MPKIHYIRFPVTSSYTLATSHCNGIWETTQHIRHRNGLLPVPTCYRLVADLSFMLHTCYGEVANLLWTCYGETGVMDFGLYWACLRIFQVYAQCITIIVYYLLIYLS